MRTNPIEKWDYPKLKVLSTLISKDLSPNRGTLKYKFALTARFAFDDMVPIYLSRTTPSEHPVNPCFGYSILCDPELLLPVSGSS